MFVIFCVHPQKLEITDPYDPDFLVLNKDDFYKIYKRLKNLQPSTYAEIKNIANSAKALTIPN